MAGTLYNPFRGQGGTYENMLPMILTCPDDEVDAVVREAMEVTSNDWIELKASGILVMPHSLIAQIYPVSNWKAGYGIGNWQID